MGLGAKQPVREVVWDQPDAELVCILCGTIVGEVYGRRVTHHANCNRALPWASGRPRCCHCGGALICDPTTDIWGAGRLPVSRGAGRVEDLP